MPYLLNNTLPTTPQVCILGYMPYLPNTLLKCIPGTSIPKSGQQRKKKKVTWTLILSLMRPEGASSGIHSALGTASGRMNLTANKQTKKQQHQRNARVQCVKCKRRHNIPASVSTCCVPCNGCWYTTSDARGGSSTVTVERIRYCLFACDIATTSILQPSFSFFIFRCSGQQITPRGGEFVQIDAATY